MSKPVAVALFALITHSTVLSFAVEGCGQQTPAAASAETFAVKVAVEACDEAPAALQLPDPALIVLVCNQLGSLAEAAIPPVPSAAPSAAPAPPPVKRAYVVEKRAYWESLKAPAVDAGG